MPTYDAAPPEVEEYAADLRLKFHGQLDACGVRIHYIMARATRNEDGDRVGVAIKLHGVRALAKVKINGLADRAEGKADATITIDGDEWPDWSEERRIAVIDHELQHVEVVFERDSQTVWKTDDFERDSQTVWKTDDLGRPVLRLRPHDFDVRGFDVIRARHGMASVEHEAVERLKVRPVQALLPFARREMTVEFATLSAGDVTVPLTPELGDKLAERLVRKVVGGEA